MSFVRYVSHLSRLKRLLVSELEPKNHISNCIYSTLFIACDYCSILIELNLAHSNKTLINSGHNYLTGQDDITAVVVKAQSRMVDKSDCHGQAQEELRFQGEVSMDMDTGNGSVGRKPANGVVALEEQVLFRD